MAGILGELLKEGVEAAEEYVSPETSPCSRGRGGEALGTLTSTVEATADQREGQGTKLATNSTPKQVLMESLLKVLFILIFSIRHFFLPLSTSSSLLPPPPK